MFEFLRKIIVNGLEYYHRFYSLYPAYVYDNQDPENMGRLQLVIPSTTGDSPYKYWALPRNVFSGKDYGFQIIPQINDKVWVEFRLGDPRTPVWSHGYFTKGQNPHPDTNTYWFRSPKGQLVMIDDTNDKIIIRNANNNEIEITPDGVSLVTDKIFLGSLGSAQQKAAMGETLQEQLNIEKARVALIIQALQSSPVVAGDGGASYKSAIIATLSSAQAPDYSNILSDKVKLDQ